MGQPLSYGTILLCVTGLWIVYTRLPENRQKTLSWLIATSTLVTLAFYVGRYYLPTIFSRLVFPLGVEHQEEIHAAIIYWWKAGGNLYTPPSSESASWVYTPGFYIVGRLWSGLFGLSLPSLRFLSLTCVTLTFFCTSVILRRITGSWFGGVVWLGLYLSMFRFFGSIDLANKESLHIFISMLGLIPLLWGPKQEQIRWNSSYVLSGFIWGLAYMTKQSQTFWVAPVVLFLSYHSLPKALVLGVTFAVTSLALTGIALLCWGESYWMWTFTLPSHLVRSFSMNSQAFAGFFALFWGFFLVGATVFYQRARGTLPSQWALDSNTLGLITAFAVGAFLASGIPANTCGGPQDFPAFAAAGCLLTALGVLAAPRTRLACLVPLLLLALGPVGNRRVYPSDQIAAQRLIERIHSEPGRVWVPYHPWAAVLAGKKPYVAIQAIKGDYTNAGFSIPEELLTRIRQGYFDLIITDYALSASPEEPERSLALRYALQEEIPWAEKWATKEGWWLSPRYVLRPK